MPHFIEVRARGTSGYRMAIQVDRVVAVHESTDNLAADVEVVSNGGGTRVIRCVEDYDRVMTLLGVQRGEEGAP